MLSLALKANRLSLRIEMEKGCRADLGPTPYPHGEPSRSWALWGDGTAGPGPGPQEGCQDLQSEPSVGAISSLSCWNLRMTKAIAYLKDP